MLIGDDSPLLRLPVKLNPKQAQFCDGLRFTAEMADIAYNDLVAHLLPLSGSAEAEIRISAARPFLCAWSIVDSAHRLRGLVENFPNLGKKNQSPEFRSFLEKAEGVEKLRNAVQHMASDIHTSAEAGKSVWGTLTWLNRQSQSTIYTCLLVPGAMMPGGNYKAINPAGLTLTSPLDHVTLTVDEVAVNLSEVMKSLAKLVQVIENGLKGAFDAFPDRAGSDLLIALKGEVGSNDWTAPQK
jgi:hypothetical protein